MSFTPDDLWAAFQNFENENGVAPKRIYCSRYTLNWLGKVCSRYFETSYDYSNFIGMNMRYRLFGIEFDIDEAMDDGTFMLVGERPVRVRFEGYGINYDRDFVTEIKREFDLSEMHLENMKPLPMDKLGDLLFGA